ncbi:MAG: helix-turn-helix domain-containing protein [Holosporaceae bacterium]|jgi:transcriptional regulator with XRE-family HTH domain|nr:helix-turn-helix domain-containing protein [Holosporaceae bacterium]
MARLWNYGVLDLLKKTREEKNLSLGEISDALKIRYCYLDAIENHDYDNLPELVYSIGFVRSYAKFLGLDAEVMANELRCALLQKSSLNGNLNDSDGIDTLLSSNCLTLFSSLHDFSPLRVACIVLIIAVAAVLIDLIGVHIL